MPFFLRLSSFLFLKEQIKDIIIEPAPLRRRSPCFRRRLVLLLCSLLYIGLRTTLGTRLHPDVPK
jgi:hypothetical protein